MSNSLGPEKEHDTTATDGIPVNASSLNWYMNDIGLSSDSLARKANVSASRLDDVLHGCAWVDLSATEQHRRKAVDSHSLFADSTASKPSMPEPVDFRRNGGEPLTYEFNRKLSDILIFLQRRQPPDIFPAIWDWLAVRLDGESPCVCPRVLHELDARNPGGDKPLVKFVEAYSSCDGDRQPAFDEIAAVGEISNDTLIGCEAPRTRPIRGLSPMRGCVACLS